ncbi:restriction endonuclease subunit S, partial [Flavobacteriaceae bacterium]|nr:restriction endonuclease subunit S [Flavobacteriaceae bacterium]
MGVENNILEKWEDCPLSDCIKIIGGGTPKTSKEEYWNGNIPWLSVVDFNNDNRWVISTEKKITKQGLEESSTKLLEKGDIIVSARGTVGAMAQLKYPMAFNQSCYGIRFKENKTNEDFLYYILKHSIEKIKRNVHGAVFDTITRQTFDFINILLPPLPEQKAIAKVLTAFDEKIELLQAQNKTLETMAQTIFKEWFGKYQIGDELPEGWRVGKLGDVMDIFDSKRVPLSKAQREAMRGDYRYYGATKVMDYVNDYLFDGIYLLFAEDGSVMDDDGYPFLQYVWGKFWVNNHTHILKGKNSFSTELLYVLCKKMKVAGIVNGAVQLKINQ